MTNPETLWLRCLEIMRVECSISQVKAAVDSAGPLLKSEIEIPIPALKNHIDDTHSLIDTKTALGIHIIIAVQVHHIFQNQKKPKEIRKNIKKLEKIERNLHELLQIIEADIEDRKIKSPFSQSLRNNVLRSWQNGSFHPFDAQTAIAISFGLPELAEKRSDQINTDVSRLYSWARQGIKYEKWALSKRPTKSGVRPGDEALNIFLMILSAKWQECSGKEPSMSFDPENEIGKGAILEFLQCCCSLLNLEELQTTEAIRARLRRIKERSQRRASKSRTEVFSPIMDFRP